MIYKALAGSFVFVALLVAVIVGAFYTGQKNGIDKYHKMCFDIGGIVVDKSNKTIVVCQKAGVIQEHELDRLDKD